MLYDLGAFHAEPAGAPVISVGNMTAGGTGKTPLVAFLTAYLLGKGVRVSIVSRGYGRASSGMHVVSDGTRVMLDARSGGDEPVQLARELPRATVIVSERRTTAARCAVRDHGAQVILLDDGFQHRAIHRDLDIVVADGKRSLMQEPLLPAGLRREPMRGLRRADVLVVMTAGDPPSRPSWVEALRGWFQGEVLYGVRRWETVRDVRTGTPVPADVLRGRRCLIVSGIGNPEQFRRSLQEAAADIRAELRFRDHHRYTADDVRNIRATAARTGADTIVTTAKDMVRLECEKEFLLLLEEVTILVPTLTIEVFPAGKLERLVDQAAGWAA